jgi:hypothetical protein
MVSDSSNYVLNCNVKTVCNPDIRGTSSGLATRLAGSTEDLDAFSGLSHQIVTCLNMETCKALKLWILH